MIKYFSSEKINYLKYYVYTYTDPLTYEIFYISKKLLIYGFTHEKMLFRIVMKVLGGENNEG